MVKTESREIDGMTVTCTQFGAMKANALLHKLTRVAAPVLMKLTGVRLSGSTDVSVLAAPLMALAGNTTPEEFNALLREILAGTTVETDGKQWPLLKTTDIDAVFSGSLFTMYAAAAFAVEVNFGPLFAAVSSAMTSDETAQATETENPSD